METINLTKKKFESLSKYGIPSYVVNTEGAMYVLPIKNRWNTQFKLLKRFYITTGDNFGNKLQTINSLIDNHDKLYIPEIVFPEKIATVGNEIVGFTMPLIDSINLKTALLSKDFSNENKIKYLKQIGLLLEEMKRVREYSGISDFYINDLHESNFIVDINSDEIKAVDIDSCKINNNQIFCSKYLSSKSFIGQIYKYQKNNFEVNPHKYGTDIQGRFIPDENTDLYCYMIIILNFLYNDDTSKFTLDEFYEYLEYLDSIGLDKELIDMIEKVASGSANENPYQLLDSILPFIGRSSKNVYTYIKKKSAN